MRAALVWLQITAAVCGAVIAALSFVVPIGVGIRLTDHRWFVPYCYDGRVRLFMIVSPEQPIDVLTPWAPRVQVKSPSLAGPPEPGSYGAPFERSLDYWISVGRYSRVTSFGGGWRLGARRAGLSDPDAPAALRLPVRRRSLGIYNTYIRVPAWLPVGLLLIQPMKRLVVARWRRRRSGRNQCLDCGYDLTGNVSGVCSECGSAIPPGLRP